MACVRCGVSGEDLDSVGFTYYQGELYCLQCYRSIAGVKRVARATVEVEEEDEGEEEELEI